MIFPLRDQFRCHTHRNRDCHHVWCNSSRYRNTLHNFERRSIRILFCRLVLHTAPLLDPIRVQQRSIGSFLGGYGKDLAEPGRFACPYNTQAVEDSTILWIHRGIIETFYNSFAQSVIYSKIKSNKNIYLSWAIVGGKGPFKFLCYISYKPQFLETEYYMQPSRLRLLWRTTTRTNFTMLLLGISLGEILSKSQAILLNTFTFQDILCDSRTRHLARKPCKALNERVVRKHI